MDICLDEAKRCRRLSPKPNSLIMAGERYGWIPLPTEIPVQNFERLISYASDEESRLIREWYIFENNKIGGEYYLKPRTEQFTDDNVWSVIESSLHKALSSCAENDASLNAIRKHLSTSATENEIIEGFLSDSNLRGNTIAVFCSNYPEKDSDLSKTITLKERIKEKMEDDDCAFIIIELDWNDDYLERFKREVLKHLKTNITREKNDLRENNPSSLSKSLSSKNTVMTDA